MIVSAHCVCIRHNTKDDLCFELLRCVRANKRDVDIVFNVYVNIMSSILNNFKLIAKFKKLIN